MWLLYSMKSRNWSAWILGAFAGFILVFSLLPAPLNTNRLPAYWDTLGHFLAYAILGFFLLLSLRGAVRNRFVLLILSWLLAVVYGGLIELVQPLFGRSSESIDLLADAAGSIVGTTIGMIVVRIQPSVSR